MKLSCKKHDLQKALEKARYCLSKSMPVLQCFLMEAKSSKLFVTSTNLEQTIRVGLDVKVDTEGAICIPGSKFFDIVRQLPDEDINLRVEKDKLHIDCANSLFHLISFPADEFPEFKPATEESSPVHMGELLPLLRKVAFAAATDDTRANLNAVYVGNDIVATDGRRLCKVLGFDKIEKEILLPLSSVRMMCSIFPEEVVSMRMNEYRVYFESENIVFATQLVDAKYPDYKSVLEDGKDMPIEFTVDRMGLIDVLKRLSLVNKDFLVRFNLNNTELIIDSSSDVGSGVETLQVNGKGKIEIGFNARYLIEGLRVIEGEDVRMKLKDSMSPCVIEPVDPGYFEKGFMYIVMPIKLREDED